MTPGLGSRQARVGDPTSWGPRRGHSSITSMFLQSWSEKKETEKFSSARGLAALRDLLPTDGFLAGDYSRERSLN